MNQDERLEHLQALDEELLQRTAYFSALRIFREFDHEKPG
jgi:hypothetical protein